jgi:hypothetical protein
MMLFALLRNELWQEDGIEITLSEEDKKRLFETAKKQAVIGLVANALIRNNAAIGREWAFKALTLTKQIEASNERINGELVKFAIYMHTNKVEYRVVKGQTVATLYPNPLLRCSGDIDFYCDANNFNLTKNLVEKAIGKNVENNSAKHIEFKMNGVQYEMHSKLTEFSYGKHQEYWERILEKDIRENNCFVRINDTDVPVLSPTINVLYIFCHIFYHLIINGIGLRQFCDLALFLDRHKDNIDKELLDKHLRSLGIKKAFTATGYVLVEMLGLKAEKFPYSLTNKDRKVGKRILKSVMEDGDWAKDKHHVKGKGVLHSMETGYISLMQSMKYVDVAPMECMLRMPKLGEFFLQKLRK